MNKKRKAKIRLGRAAKFSAAITAGTVAVGAGISIPVYLKTQKEMDKAIGEASNATLGVDELTKQLGFAAGQDDIVKYIKGGYKVKYSSGVTKIYKTAKDDAKDDLVLTIGEDGKISTKYPMTGTAAKTIISIILLVKNHLVNEMNAEKEILVPFLHEIIKSGMHGSEGSPLITGARNRLAYNLSDDSELMQGLDSSREEDNKAKYRDMIMNSIKDFWQGFGAQHELANKSFEEWNKHNQDNEKYFDEILSSTSVYQLNEILKYQGYTMDELLKYFTVVKNTYKEMMIKIEKHNQELKNLLIAFEKDKSSKNIFKKITTNYGNTFIALSKTYGLEKGKQKIPNSESIRNKLIDFLKENHNLSQKSENFMISEIKKMINLKKTKKGEIGQTEIMATNSKRIVVDGKVYTIQGISTIPDENNKVPVNKYILFKKNLNEPKLWNGEMSFITKREQKQLINIIDQTTIRGIDISKHASSYSQIIKYIANSNDKNIKVDLMLDNLDKPVYWNTFTNAVASPDVFNSIGTYWDKLKSYPERIQKIITDYNGSMKGFKFTQLDEIVKKMHIDPNNKWPGGVVLDYALQNVNDRDEFHNRDNYLEIIITAINQLISWNGWSWVDKTFVGKSFDPVIQLLEKATIKDFESRDTLVNSVIDKIGRT